MALSAIRAGAAYVELFLRDMSLVKGLAIAGVKLKQWSVGLQTLSGSVSKMGTDLLALGLKVAIPIGFAVRSFTTYGAGLYDMSKRTGLAVETLSGLKSGIEQAGSSLEEFEGSYKKLTTAITLGVRGNAEAQDAFRALGLDAFRLAKMLPEQQIDAVADSLAKVQNPSARAALAMKVLGESSGRLMPLFDRGAAGLREFKAAAAARGEIITGDDAAKAKDFSIAFNQLANAGKKALFEIGSAVAPALGSLARWLTVSTQAIGEFLRNNQWLVKVAALVGASFLFDGVRAKVAAVAIGLLGSVLGTLAMGIKAVGVAVGVVKTVFTFLSVAGSLVTTFVSAIGGLASGVGGIVGLFGGLLGIIAPLAPFLLAGGAAFLLFSDKGKSAAKSVGSAFGTAFTNVKKAGQSTWEYLGEVFGGVKDRAMEAWGGISDALDAGEFGLAAKIATSALEGEWIRFKGWFLDMWEDIVAKVTGWIGGIADKAKEALADAQSSTAGGIVGTQQVIENNSVISGAMAAVPGVAILNDLWRGTLGMQSSLTPNAPTANQIAPNLADQERQARDRRERERKEAADAAQADRDLRRRIDNDNRDEELSIQAAEMQRLREVARQAKVASDAARVKAPAGQLPTIDDVVTARQKVDVVGTFNTAALSGMGASSLAERQFRVIDSQRKDIAKIREAVGSFAPQVRG